LSDAQSTAHATFNRALDRGAVALDVKGFKHFDKLDARAAPQGEMGNVPFLATNFAVLSTTFLTSGGG
jgi:hypothetical protein